MSKFNPSCYKEKHIHSSAGVDIAIQQDTMNVLFTKSTNPSRRNQREREREMLQLGRMSLSSGWLSLKCSYRSLTPFATPKIRAIVSRMAAIVQVM